MDRLFRESELRRPKWDEVHYADGATYGERTIERAITTTSERYTPDSRDTSAEDGREGSREVADTGEMSVDRDRVAYLEEKAQLLADQVADLEATVAKREAKIADLEAERVALEAALADCQSTLEASPSAANSRGDEMDESRSIWMALKRSIRSD